MEKHWEKNLEKKPRETLQNQYLKGFLNTRAKEEEKKNDHRRLKSTFRAVLTSE